MMLAKIIPSTFKTSVPNTVLKTNEFPLAKASPMAVKGGINVTVIATPGKVLFIKLGFAQA